MSEKNQERLKELSKLVCEFLSRCFPDCNFVALVEISDGNIITMANMKPEAMMEVFKEVTKTKGLYTDISDNKEKYN